jgi:hypothetical protein
MKRTLLILSLLAGAFSASAQCTPDPSVTSGISPDTATGMSVSYVGQSYSEVFTFVVPADTTYQGQTVNISYVELDDVVGLPANYDYACNPTNCQFPGGTTKCVDLYSVTDPVVGQVGSYPVTILATPYVDFGFGDVSAGQTTYDGYYLVVEEQTPASIAKVGKGDMVSLIAYPNPTSGLTTIEFAMGYSSNVTFAITNLLGEVVNTQKLGASKGLNTIQLDASDFSNGIYLYTITDGVNSIAKKLTVNK